MAKPTLTDLIQLHERKWGEYQYPDRPTLDQLLTGYVIAVWIVGKRFIFSVHNDAQELNDVITRVITGQSDERKLARVFVNRVEYEFRVGIIPPRRRLARVTPVSKATIALNRPPKISPGQPSPLPPEPGKRHGQHLPGRQVDLLPGRKVKIRLGRDS